MTDLARHHTKCQHKFYGMTCEQFNEMYEAAHGQCQVCGVLGSDTPHGMLHIDHDYRGVRGLLCSRCNTSLHRALLDAASVAQYLRSPWHARPRQLRLFQVYRVRGSKHPTGWRRC